MSEYNKEQYDALAMVCTQLARISPSQRQKLANRLDGYLAFRREVDEFLQRHFSEICTANCFQSRLSACCSKEGIVTFFADGVINALLSREDELERLAGILADDNEKRACVYLGRGGCRWRLPPIVCAMFICEDAKKNAFRADPTSERRWKSIQQQRKRYTWPDRPVLFDHLEQVFIDIGLESELMYLHNSPGMLRVKQRAGLYKS